GTMSPETASPARRFAFARRPRSDIELEPNHGAHADDVDRLAADDPRPGTQTARGHERGFVEERTRRLDDHRRMHLAVPSHGELDDDIAFDAAPRREGRIARRLLRDRLYASKVERRLKHRGELSGIRRESLRGGERGLRPERLARESG